MIVPSKYVVKHTAVQTILHIKRKKMMPGLMKTANTRWVFNNREKYLREIKMISRALISYALVHDIIRQSKISNRRRTPH